MKSLCRTDSVHLRIASIYRCQINSEAEIGKLFLLSKDCATSRGWRIGIMYTTSSRMFFQKRNNTAIRGSFQNQTRPPFRMASTKRKALTAYGEFEDFLSNSSYPSSDGGI